MDVFKTLLLDTPDSLNAITGTLQIANGGTGATDAAGARDNLLPDYTGNVGKVLTVNSGATDVEWTTNGAGTVTSVDVSGGTTGLTTSGGPVTSSGTITLAGTLAVANGGTGITSLGSGVATFLGTPSSANLAAAVTDETGTGALVFASSPTLVTPALGAATATSINGVTVTGTSTPALSVTGTTAVSGTNTGDQTTITGNAGTATILETARNINGVSFNGSADITVAAAAGTLTGATLAAGVTASSLTSLGTIASLTATALTVNDNSTLGSSNTDTVNFNARVASDINPSTDDTYDLGVTGHEWRNLNIDGTANIDSLVADTADINGGTIDATAIGATTPSTVAATTLSASGASTFTNSAPSAIGGLGFRNRIINGDMRIDQRNEGAAVTHSGGSNLYTLDRWVCNSTGTPQFSVQRVADAPAGFINSAKITTTTAGTPASGDFSYFGQYLEGLNVADLGFGTASAKTIAVSFWIKSSLTGTFGGIIGNPANNRRYPFSFSIDLANTWEFKTLAIPGDTTGTWPTTNGVGLLFFLDTGSGSTIKGTAGAWAASNVIGVTGGTNLVASAAATMNITGVQLEIGNAATEFERRPFGQEQELCFRYFRRYASDASNHCLLPGYALANATTGGYGPVQISPIMRDNPTLSVSAAADLSVDTSGTAAALSAVSIYGGYTTKNSVLLNFTVASGLSNGQAYMFRVNSGTGKHASFSAEL
jgi:hypothetical protein